ncbi:carboxymuconolactone decarboxylase family protein [Arthrobacter sp. GCM10027362]|uniref:carboxymuconolactone decarboxylase family protein n=1 Tax=Arthrobacter sp. GCM10027362 TaxID=3273379 RepID=UPI00362A4845
MEKQHSHEQTFQEGLEIRKEVLGAAHVERSLANVSEFARPMQELVTEYCWGAVWSREGLERKTRSMINLAMLTALNRGHELSVHVKGAINNGCTPEEIQEVLMQTAIYVGVPAALESFRIAEATLKEMSVNV